ncbi:hypothetical protein QBC39DRAFT_400609, partial [Podospora conica]
MSCLTCSSPLTLSLAPDSSSESSSGGPSNPTVDTVPDDLHLTTCSHHFHWQCLIDQSPTISLTLRCPACDTYLPTPSTSTSTSSQPTIPAIYTSENGASPLDLLPILTEEAFLLANPSARPARALHTLAAEGDVEGMVDLLRDVAGEEVDVVRWTDPLNGGKTALHVAVEAGQEEVVWFLLWVGSRVEEGRFPGVVVQLAGAMGVGRGDFGVGEDVRGLRDGSGRVAGE